MSHFLKSMQAMLLIAILSPFAANSALLGVDPEQPILKYAPTSSVVYTVANRGLLINASMKSMEPIGGGVALISGNGQLHIDVSVALDGSVLSGVAAHDLQITGSIDVDRDGTPEYSGVLITGRVKAMGSLAFAGFTVSYMDFRFEVTGGAMAADYAGRDFVVDMLMENSTFTGSFDSNFSSTLKGDAGGMAMVDGICSGEIGDLLWYDANGNGVKDNGESPLAGVTLTLLDGAGASLQTTTTDAAGAYGFADLCAGDYRISVTPATLPIGLDQPTFDFDGPGTPHVADVTLATDDSINRDLDFGYTGNGSIGDRVWSDSNGDGVQDTGEPGIGGVEITLSVDLDGDGNPDYSSTQTTNSDGSYLFTNLPAGSYTVSVDDATVPAGMDFPTYDLDGTSSVNSSEVELSAGQNRDDVDFGYSGPGSLGDTVWLDLNDNGVQDADEPGLENVVVLLEGDTNGDGNADIVLSAATDDAGHYIFESLPPGEYRVAVDINSLPGGLIQTFDRDSNGSNGALDDQTRLSLAPAETVLDVDFGYTGIGELGDRVWYDTNADTVQDSGELGLNAVLLTLSADIDGDNLEDFTSTALTDSDGLYLFTGLPAGDYTVSIDPATLLGGIEQTYDLSGALDHQATATLAGGAFRDDVDFGYTGLGVIGDTVWLDLNADGVQDSNEFGLSGVKVTLSGDFNGDGQIEQRVTFTGPTGIYSFTRLPAGSYTVTVDPATLPGGVTATFDADGIASTHSSSLILGGGETRLDQDFGYVGSASIGDQVWEDLDGDQSQGQNEPVLGGIILELSDGNGNVIATTTTDADGSYLFEGLVGGSYSVDVVDASVPANYELTTGSDPIAVDLQDGEDYLDADFGYRLTPARIGDRVWLDLDANGVQDAGESGVANVLVELLDGNDLLVDSTTTDSDGLYEFNVDPGSYSVRVIAPAGFAITAANNGDDSLDSDAGSDGRMAITTLDPGEDDPTWDAGIYPLGSIGDRIWSDLDGDGQQDNGEPGIAGITVELLDANGSVIDSAVTDGNGNYSFNDLPAAAYRVRVTNSAGALDSYELTGDPDSSKDGQHPLTLAPGQHIDTVDFGYRQLASIGDRVWLDSNANGLQDNGETGISGVSVRLLDAAGSVVSTTATDNNGIYGFNVAPGDYRIQVIAPAGHILTAANAGDDALDSDAAADGRMDLTTLSPGENDLDWDAGVYPLGSIGDRIWRDSNGDGVQNAAETGIAGITVELRNSNGDLIDTATTDAAGNYLFTDLPVDSYTVNVTDSGNLLDGFDQTGDPDSSLDGSHSLTLNAGQNIDTVDFGYRQRATIGDRVWLDSNANGVQDSGDTGIEAITVNLLDGNGAVVDSTSTGVDGIYSFNTAPGNYRIQVELPANYGVSPARVGAATTDSDAASDGSMAQTVLDDGETDLSWDAGIYPLGSIGDRIWSDLNGDGQQDGNETGIPGVTVELLNGDGDLLDSTTTGADGIYSFNDLPPGDYRVRITDTANLLSGHEQTGDPDSDKDGSHSLSLTAGENIDSVDFGYQQQASIGDRVWIDRNGNGEQDGNEPGLAGVSVNLLDSNGAVVDSTSTDANGNYGFSATPGDYRIQVIAPAGYVFTDADQGNDDAADSDVNSNGDAALTTLDPGENDPSWDAGVFQLGSLGDRIWSDLNGDGQQDGNEAGIAGVTVELLDGNGQVIDTTTTAANGIYTFNNLLEGDYSVRVTDNGNVLGGYSQTGDPDSTIDGQHSVSLAAGENIDTIDFGYQQLANIGDRVWYDSNANGEQDNRENGIANITVSLLDGNGQVLDTTSTDASGLYGFNSLTPGDYQIRVSVPAGYQISTADQGGDNAADSDINSAGLTIVTTLDAGENDPSWDAGIYQYGSLGDRVWSDLNGDGQQDGNEAGIAGVTIELLDGNGQVIGTTTTGAKGIYTFNNLLEGDYSVRVTDNSNVLDGYSQTGDPDSTIDGQHSVSLAAGENIDTIDFGYQQLASIGDRVWYDSNANGEQDNGENGIANITVSLLDGNGQVIDTTNTDANGLYGFSSLTPSEYQIRVSVPAGYQISSADQGGNDANDSDINGAGLTIVTSLTAGENNPSWDAGLYQLAAIGDRIWLDSNANGIQDNAETGVAGVTVRLLNAAGTQVATTSTDSNGLYGFANLLPATYQVKVDAPAGYLISPANQDGNDAADSDADSNGLMSQTTLVANETDLSWDAGLYQPASIGNYVWQDNNRDGIQDAAEPALAGVEVHLIDAAGTQVGNTTTDANGIYGFSDLTPGIYHVEVIKPSVLLFTNSDAANDDSLDSDANVLSGRMADTELVSGENDPNWDAGLYSDLIPPQGFANLGNRVWLDSNADGIQDADENGIAGITVRLFDGSGNQLDSTVTDNAGIYGFDTLQAGDYQVRIDVPVAYQVSPIDTTADVLDSDIDGSGVMAITNLVSGESDPSWDAGLYPASNDICLPALDFETAGNGARLHSGQIIDDEWSNRGITVTTHDPANHPAMIFDSASPTGGDPDLGSPNQSFGGPGTGNGGIAGENGENAIALGKLLIISEDGDSNDPDDNAAGGTLIFNFANPVRLDAVQLLDIEEAGGSVTAFDSNGNSIATLPIQTLGNNSVQNVAIAARNVSRLEVKLAGSGAVSGLVFCDDSDPLLAGIGDRIWMDANQNGVQDSGENGIAGVTVNLFDANGTLFDSVETDANGLYAFTNLAAAEYRVQVVIPAGFSVSPRDAANSDFSDSDMDDNGAMPGTVLSAGEFDPSWDGGLYRLDCQACDGKVTDLSVRYNGKDTAFIEVTQKKGGVVFSGSVQPGETFSFSGTDKKGTLGTEITFSVNGRSNAKLHTSCSVAIGPGTVAGDFEVTAGSSRNGGLLCPVDAGNGGGNGGNGECDECEGKVTDLTLRYTGSVAALIEVQQKKGGTVFSDTVQPGETFHFVGTDKGTLGTRITLFVNGNEDASLHTSCSVAIGPGTVAGQFEVIEGSSLKGGLLCPVDGGANGDGSGGSDCNECDGKVTDLTMRYNGSDAALIEVSQKKGGVVFSATVQPGETFHFAGTDKKGTLGTEITFTVNGSVNAKMHTSCSVAIGPGTVAGDFEVVEGSSRNGGLLCPVAGGGNGGGHDGGSGGSDCNECEGKVTDLTLRYTGSVAALIEVQQKKGGSVFVDTVQPGETFHVVGTDKGTLGTRITLFVNGNEDASLHTSCSVAIGPGTVAGQFVVVEGSSLKGGQLCAVAGGGNGGGNGDSSDESGGSDGSDCNECDGKVTDLTLRYNGSAAALVGVQQKKGGAVFSSTVAPGETFHIAGTDKGTLGTEITFTVNGSVNAKLHTSCSVAVGPGTVAGDFEVIEGSSRNGGTLCPVDVANDGGSGSGGKCGSGGKDRGDRGRHDRDRDSKRGGGKCGGESSKGSSRPKHLGSAKGDNLFDLRDRSDRSAGGKCGGDNTRKKGRDSKGDSASKRDRSSNSDNRFDLSDRSDRSGDAGRKGKSTHNQDRGSRSSSSKCGGGRGD